MGHISYCELWIHFEDTLFVAHFLFQACCSVGAESYGGRVACCNQVWQVYTSYTPKPLRGEHWTTPLNSFVLHRTSELGFLCFAQNIRIRFVPCIPWGRAWFLRGDSALRFCGRHLLTLHIPPVPPLLSSAGGGVWFEGGFWLLQISDSLPHCALTALRLLTLRHIKKSGGVFHELPILVYKCSLTWSFRQCRKRGRAITNVHERFPEPALPSKALDN